MIFTNCGKICILLLWIAEVDKLCEQCRIYLFKFGKALRRPDTLWKFNFFIIKRDKKDGTKRKRDDNDDINYVDDDYRCQCWCKVLSCLQNICSIGNLLSTQCNKIQIFAPGSWANVKNTSQTRHHSLEQIWPLQIFPLVKYEDLGFTFQHVLHV